MADAFYCANIRSGCRFAVAAAYKNWRNVAEREVPGIMPSFWDGQTSDEYTINVIECCARQE